MVENPHRLTAVELDDAGLPTPTPEIEQERRVAIYDLLEENVFRLIPREGEAEPVGPYALQLAVQERHLVFAVADARGNAVANWHLSLTPFRAAVKDYFTICESYFDAIRRLPPHQIEAIDMGRRGVHDEGSRILMERLHDKVEIDMPTARRLFTLICVLHFRG